MAFWQRRKNGYVYVYRSINGKQTPLPRKQIKHLDHQPDDVIEHFVQSLEIPKPKPISHDLLSKRLDEFCKYELDRGLNPASVTLKRNALNFHVFPFFLSQEPPMPDPNQWVYKCNKLLDYLNEQKVSHRSIQRCNTSLTTFWNWLADEGLVDNNVKLRLRKPRVTTSETPLKFHLTPEQVIEWSKTASRDFALIGLCGYFFSLRTQEMLALTKSDFIAGSKASILECGKVMKQNGLYDKFAVNITKQNQKSTKNTRAKPKSGSKGTVACFNAEAAKMIVSILNESEPDKLLIPYSVDYNLKRWSENGIPGVTMKDLRRASLYWLGTYAGMGVIELKNHARHSNVETTMLYCRRATEVVEAQDEYDLDS